MSTPNRNGGFVVLERSRMQASDEGVRPEGRGGDGLPVAEEKLDS